MVQLFRGFDIDEDTPVQYVGVYVTRWQSGWGEPSIMFSAANDGEVLEVARQLPEVAALAEATKRLELAADALQCQLDQDDPAVIETRKAMDAAAVAYAPFEEDHVKNQDPH